VDEYILIDTLVNKDNKQTEPAVSDRDFHWKTYKITGDEGPFYCWILMTVYGNIAHDGQF
jgi:hypothetical protein